jgi:protoporphyrinogen oxidase
MKQPFVIIGAGPCGLGAAWRLKELGADDVTVYEAAAVPGGVSSSVTDGAGFVWDIGGHVLHSHYGYFDRVIGGIMDGEMSELKRSAWVSVANRFVPFPFQQHLDRLPARMAAVCRSGLAGAAAAAGAAAPVTFADWIWSTYGPGIAETFLLPYNRKVWSCLPETMDWHWTADRVAPASDGRGAWGPNARFRYPLRGGTGDIWRRTADNLKGCIRYGRTVTAVDVRARLLRFADGTAASYGHMLSTIPLPHLSRMVTGISVPRTVGHLAATAVTAVGLGIRGTLPSVLRTKSWIYFPQPDVPFFRATVLSRYSPHNAPPGHWSLLLEVSRPGGSAPDSGIVGACIDGAAAVGLLPDRNAVVDRYSVTADPAYPVPTLDRDAVADPWLAALDTAGIASRGRFGAWKYEIGNMDHAFMQGVEWADRVTSGAGETTFLSAVRRT